MNVTFNIPDHLALEVLASLTAILKGEQQEHAEAKAVPNTAHDWFNQLPPGYRERAKRNAVAGDNLIKLYQSLQDALQGAFVWGNSPEGHQFWDDVDDHVILGSGLPSLSSIPSDS